MRFRWPRRILSRLRDLALTALLADHLLNGLGGWLALSAGLTIAAGVTLLMATAATTHAKAVSTENRLNAYVAQTNQTVDAYDTRLDHLEQGIFPNVPGAGIVTMTAANAGPYALHVGALANLTGGPNTTFLATLTQCGPQGTAGGNDNNTGSSWASGERGYVNASINAINAIRASLVNHGFMAP